MEPLIVISEEVEVTPQDRQAVFTIYPENWTESEQSMVIHIQSSQDGEQWDDEAVFTVPESSGQIKMPYILGYKEGFPEPALVRAVCEVTGDIDFTIDSKVSAEYTPFNFIKGDQP